MLLALAPAAQSGGPDVYQHVSRHMSIRLRLALGPVWVRLDWHALAGPAVTEIRTAHRIGEPPRTVPVPVAETVAAVSADRSWPELDPVVVRSVHPAGRSQEHPPLARALGRAVPLTDLRELRARTVREVVEHCERVVLRWQRVEVRRPGPVILPSAPVAAAPPTVRRGRPGRDGWQDGPPPAPSADDAAAHSRPATAGSGPAAVDVDRLAEQVIRRIDHRIVAYRERLGRGP